MARKKVPAITKASTRPQVRWLLKPRMEIEAAARWFRCHQEPADTMTDGARAEIAGPSGAETAAGSNSEPCYLCPRYKSRDSEKECWRATCAELQALLDDILQNTFEGKAAITVIDWLRSFTSPYDRPTFRVEVVDNENVTQAHIVKLALAGKLEPKKDDKKAAKICARLKQELAGYHYLRNHGKGTASPVFARLKEGYTDSGGLQSLKYSDAEMTLRAGETVVSLERAILDACIGSQRFLDSVEATIVQLFAELEDAWYRHAQPRAASTTDASYLKQRVRPGQKNWLDRKTEASRARDEVLWTLSDRNIEFIDPALYFNPASWPETPEMLVGTAHGDLHARNVLVGIMEGEARWPVVFDYEDVLCCNPVAWDFVKLETELKKAAFSDPTFLKAGSDKELVQQLYEFEVELHDRTERCYNHNSWAEPMNGKDPAAKLAHVILTIRRMAWKCLEMRRGRSRKWLHEYYFLLAAYGVYAARFPVSREVRPLKALFVGAGIAAFRHAYGEDLGERMVAQRKVDALEAIARGCAAGELAEEAGTPEDGSKSPDPPGAAEPERTPGASGPRMIDAWTPREIIGHRGDLEYAKKLARSEQLACIEKAVRLLRRLMKEHPFALEPAYECVFALLELAKCAKPDEKNCDRKRLWREADQLLQRAEAQFRCQMHHELLSRRGRLYKDQANAHFADGHTERAQALYVQAAKAYEKAAGVSDPREKYYPGINAATCYWLCGQEEDAGKTVTQVLGWVKDEEKKLGEDNSREKMWVLATKGEACVISGLAKVAAADTWDQAAEAYGAALNIAKREGELPQQSSTMIEQLDRIRQMAEKRQRPKDAAEKLQQLVDKLKQKAGQ